MITEYADDTIYTNNLKAKDFAKRFKNNFMIPLLEANMKILFSRKSQFVGSKCLLFVIRYIKQACCIPETMQKIQPYSE